MVTPTALPKGIELCTVDAQYLQTIQRTLTTTQQYYMLLSHVSFPEFSYTHHVGSIKALVFDSPGVEIVQEFNMTIPLEDETANGFQ